MDIFVMYPVAWLLFMALGGFGFIASRGSPTAYFLFQILFAGLVLFIFRDTFGAMDATIWMIYAIGFSLYSVAFIAGMIVNSENMIWVVVFQFCAFLISYTILPWMFGIGVM